jgi:hypothetical protein
VLRERLELRVTADERIEMLRQTHIVSNHADRTGAADLPKRGTMLWRLFL